MTRAEQMPAAIRALIESHQNFMCVGHKDADADSLGSVLAFTEVLRGLGRRADPWVPDPLPTLLAHLPGYAEVNRTEAPEDAVVFAFDAGSPARFGNLRARIERAPAVVVIDHHLSNEGFGTLHLVRPEAAATGEIVFRLLQAWGLEISPQAATNLYAALFTDTGGFRHANTTAESLEIGAALARLGADPAWIALKSYKSLPASTLRLHAATTAASHYECDDRLVWSEVRQSTLQAVGAILEQAEGIIDQLQSLDTMLCALLFKEVEPRLTKVSLRTRVPVAAHELVGQFGGGGHARAAGVEMALPIDEVEALLLPAARAAATLAPV